jgi:hypothetical protein
MKKPGVPFIDARDIVTKNFSRKGYFLNDDGSEAVHILARKSIENL